MKEIVLITATVYGGSAVILGAFGAHLLKRKFTSEQMNSFETGVRYQLIHAVVLLVVGLNIPIITTVELIMAWLFIVGTFLFSLSIYGLCLTSAQGKKLKFLGPITPLGGFFLILAWIFLLVIVSLYGTHL